jgi:glycogen operon protein
MPLSPDRAESRPIRLWPGRPYPLGATWDGDGVNFALFSEHAAGVDLCLFDPTGGREERVPLRERTDLVWHGYVPGLAPGQLYGYRVHGAYDPAKGFRFNPAKLLIDPYARALAGTLTWRDECFGYRVGDPAADLSRDDRDSAPFVPKAVVVDPAFEWEDDRPPRTPWHQSIVYEVHAKGFTARHPGVPARLRGTYAGLASPAALDHLTALGVTAVELLPVHHHADEQRVVRRGLVNYWGYNTLAFFAPEGRYASRHDPGGAVREFKAMVRALHRAGLEVILDVVYNHTAEGDHLGPTLSFRGIDNPVYYRLTRDRPRYYEDYTGTGNTANMTHPRTLQLLMDSLRYWVQEMHVDGFRFDLAPALARVFHEVQRLSPFFDLIHQDPVISQVKLIAEPWDLGDGGYQVGNFPVGWAEWNGRYRDAIRRYWRGDQGQVADLAYRLTGSSDLYQDDGRRPNASINFVTAHDGFTLADLVSYERKHNEANGEDNRDGDDANLSWNGGVEGPTNDPAILALRERQARNFLATLLLSQGVPMLCGGDEIGRTQRGNNNAYCQDNELSWLDWDLDPRARGLLEFTRRLLRLRREHQELHRRKFFQGRPLCQAGIKDLAWLRPDGGEMAEAEWRESRLQVFGFRLCGEAMDDVDERGEPITDDTLLVLLNAGVAPVSFVLPDAHPGDRWEVLIDTAATAAPERRTVAVGAPQPLAERSLQLLRACPPD